MVNVLTRSYDNRRSHCNMHETVLTPDLVGRRGVKRAFSLPIPDDPRIEAQPVFADNVLMADNKRHNIVIVCSMDNRVYCFDSATGEPLWMQKIGTGIEGSKTIDAWQINVNWGILSTPVIDLDTLTLYVCAWTSFDKSVKNARFCFYGLALEDGIQSKQPIDLSPVTYQTHGLPQVTFGAAARKQRCGLLLTNNGGRKAVHIAFGSVSESLNSARGWVISIDPKAWRVAASWATTNRYSGGGIWQGAEGLSADAQGNIYGVTGNGAFDGMTDFGESYIKLNYHVSTLGAASLNIVDWFSPFSDAGRVGEPQDQPQITATDDNGDVPSNMDAWNDMDLGSAGPLLIESLDLLVGSGKDGIGYVMDVNDMGKTQLSDFVDPPKNYAKLKVPPFWFTFFPGWGPSPHPQKFSDLNVNYFQRTHHLHGTPAHYASARRGDMLFCMGENTQLRAWTIDASGAVTFLADSDEIASPAAPIPPGGMPGGLLTVSANGGTNGIVWVLVPFGDANKEVTPGALYAYDAENFDTRKDGSKKLRLLWRSDQWGLTFMHPKFNVPVVVNGRVYVPTYSGRVDVYDLT